MCLEFCLHCVLQLKSAPQFCLFILCCVFMCLVWVFFTFVLFWVTSLFIDTARFVYRSFTTFIFLWFTYPHRNIGSLCFSRKSSVFIYNAPDRNADFGILRETFALMPLHRSADVLIWEYMPNSRWERLLARAI